MSVKLTIITSGETLISEMQELVADKDQASPHAYLLENPHIVKTTGKQFITEEEKELVDKMNQVLDDVLIED